jgi:hypothetical protein
VRKNSAGWLLILLISPNEQDVDLEETKRIVTANLSIQIKF